MEPIERVWVPFGPKPEQRRSEDPSRVGGSRLKRSYLERTLSECWKKEAEQAGIIL